MLKKIDCMLKVDQIPKQKLEFELCFHLVQLC